jgi:hypothetical protein
VTLLKSIVVLLALANVGYFLWTRGIAHPQDAGGASPAATLKLTSEVPGSPRSAAANDDQASPSGAAGIVGAGGGVDAPGVAAPGVAAPGATSGLAGSGLATPGAMPGLAPPGPGSAALLTNVKRCISVGPFRDVSETAHAASTLRSGGYDPRQRVAEGEVWAGVWVYLPIPPARSSEQLLAKLKAAGIEDALEMPGPNESSVISLGLYGDQKRAQTRVAQAQALGFNPGIADRKRTGDVYWIDIDLKPTDSVLKPSDLQSEMGHIQRLEVKGCPSGGATPP